ncbi:MAG: hypothetical protein ABIG28_01705 [archaeon]
MVGKEKAEKKDEEKKEEKDSKPSWVKMKSSDLENLVVGYAKEGKSLGQIGLLLRDKHGIPKTKLLGKRIIDILNDKGVEFKGEKQIAGERVQKLKNHIAKNKHDHPASRALTKELWVLHRMAKREEN